jgi:hypothetical protein
MATTKHSQPAPVEVWAWAQLKAWTLTVDHKLAVIIAALNVLLESGGTVSPALQEALNELGGAIQTVDDKVPDKPTTQEQ